MSRANDKPAANLVRAEVTEDDLILKSTAPRVTLAGLDDIIVSEHYFTAADGVAGADYGDRKVASPLDLLTICVLVLKNGFTVTGESACASPANFNADIGRRLAFSNAKNKIWPLEGYFLKQQIHDRAVMFKRTAGIVMTEKDRATNDKLQMLGIISQLPTADQATIKAIAGQLRDIVVNDGGNGVLAFTLVGLEIQEAAS
jgi:hypothetical protein